MAMAIAVIPYSSVLLVFFWRGGGGRENKDASNEAFDLFLSNYSVSCH